MKHTIGIAALALGIMFGGSSAVGQERRAPAEEQEQKREELKQLRDTLQQTWQDTMKKLQDMGAELEDRAREAVAEPTAPTYLVEFSVPDTPLNVATSTTAGKPISVEGVWTVPMAGNDEKSTARPTPKRSPANARRQGGGARRGVLEIDGRLRPLENADFVALECAGVANWPARAKGDSLSLTFDVSYNAPLGKEVMLARQGQREIRVKISRVEGPAPKPKDEASN